LAATIAQAGDQAASGAEALAQQRDALGGAMRGIVSSLGFLAAAAAWVLGGLGVLGLAMWIDALCPRATARVARVYDAGRAGIIRCFIAGFVNVLIGAFLVALLTQQPALSLLAFLLALVLIVIAVFGLAGAYKTLGARLAPGSPASLRLLYGGGVISVSFLAPIIGQILLVLVLLRGFGAAVLAMLGAGSAEPPAEEEEAQQQVE
jgi:hypothetical protein